MTRAWTSEPVDVTTGEDDIERCPVCGSVSFSYLGVLGNIAWYRCRHCGTDIPEEV